MALKVRNHELYHELSLDNTGTKIIDLNIKEPVSCIHMSFIGINGSISNVDNWMNDIITKIELVDGSDVIISASLKELMARHAFRTNKMPYTEFVESGDKAQRDDVDLFFGRYLWDKEYYFDPGKFSNPQLKISTDEDVVRALGDDGFLSGSFKVSIVARLMVEGAKDAKGLFMTKEIYEFISETSGEKRIELPTDYPYFALLIMAPNKDCKDIDEFISQIKISCDFDKFIPLNQYTKYLLHENRCDYGPFKARGIWYRKGHDKVHYPVHYNPTICPLCTVSGHNLISQYNWSGESDIIITDSAGEETTSEEEIWAEVMGGGPFASVWVPFGILEDPDTYFNAPGYGDIKLILTQAGSGIVKVVLDQLRLYAK
jgi:hypothetical protein